MLGTALMASAVHAEEPESTVVEESPIEAEVATPEESVEEEANIDLDLVDFVDLFQETVVDLTESDKGKLFLLVEFVSQANDRLEVLLQEEKFEEATRMLEKFNIDVEKVQELLTTPSANDELEENEEGKEEVTTEEDEELEELEEAFTDKTSMRGVNLRALLEREDLPAPARAGIQKALANQEKALEKRQLAKERKEQRKALKAENKEEKAPKADHVEQVMIEEAGEKEETRPEEQVPTSVEQKQAQPKQEKAQKAQENAQKHAEQGQQRAAEAKEKAKQNGPANSNGNKSENPNKPANPGRP